MKRRRMKGRSTAAHPGRSVWVASLLCLLAGSTCAQISSQNVERHFITNARAAALADAVIADPADICSMYWNPSSIAFLQDRSVVLNYSLERIRGRDNIMNENVAVSLLNHKDIAVGLGATYSHVGHLENGSPLSGYSFNQGSLDVAMAMALSRFFSVGIVSTVRYGQVRSQSSAAVSAALGIMYYPSSRISYALSYQGVGDGIDYSFDSTEAQTALMTRTLSQSLQIGIASRFNVVGGRPAVVLTAASQKMFGTKGFIYKGGVEAWVLKFLALRVGYWVGTETVAARYGGGIRLGQWQVDYGISTTALEPRFHQISLSYCLIDHPNRR